MAEVHRVMPRLWLLVLLASPAFAWPALVLGQEGSLPLARTDVVVLREGAFVTWTVSVGYRGPRQPVLLMLASPVPSAKPGLAAEAALDQLDACTAPRLVERVQEDPCAPACVSPPSPDAGATSEPSPALYLLPAGRPAELKKALQGLGWPWSEELEAGWRRLSASGASVLVTRLAPGSEDEEGARLPPISWRARSAAVIVPLGDQPGETLLFAIERGVADEVRERDHVLLESGSADAGAFVAPLLAQEQAALARGEVVVESVTRLGCFEAGTGLAGALGFEVTHLEPPVPARFELTKQPQSRELQSARMGLLAGAGYANLVGNHLKSALAPPLTLPPPARELALEVLAELLSVTRLRVRGSGIIELVPAAPRQGSALFSPSAAMRWAPHSSTAPVALGAEVVLERPWVGPSCEKPFPRWTSRVLARLPRASAAPAGTEPAAPASGLPTLTLPDLGATPKALASMPAWERRLVEQQLQLARLRAAR